MTHPFSSRRRAALAAGAVAAVAVAGLAGTTSYAAASGDATPVTGTETGAGTIATGSDAAPGDTTPTTPPDVDVNDSAAALVAQAQLAAQAQSAPATTHFLTSAPDTTVLAMDGSTGTVRWQANLAGFLTAASSKKPTQVALGYVRAHAAALGLKPADLSTFHLARDYRDIDGVHHLYFQQRFNGHTVIRNGLTAAVTRHGRLLMVGGSPVHKSGVGTSSSPTVATPGQALAEARGALPTTSATSNDSASRGLFLTPRGLRPAWQAVTMSTTDPAVTVIDSTTGRVLQRQSLVDHESGTDSTGKVFRYFPHARRGGRQVTVDFTKRHWLGAHASILSGNNAHAYSDVNDNNRASPSEEVHPRTKQSWSYPLTPFHLSFARSFCSNPWPCSWNPDQPFSWQTNRAQNATQVFYYVNNWHDHLQAAPIGFTEEAGNFQQVNHTGHGQGDDAVTTQTDDGADTAHGLPDAAHIDNANMATPPDGHHPVMQMYLQHMPHQSYPGGDPFSPTNVGDEADTVYHEYTHGLSNRLVVDVQGRSTLGNVQAGAMGEGWSDWYAMDYLVKTGLAPDRRGVPDVVIFPYDGQGVKLDRTEPMDCKVGEQVHQCPGGAIGRRGGYTYADYGKVIGFPEVHGDSEIWSQTLWDLRSALGSAKTESLVTRAMELSPYNPSYLDMRNAILLADVAVFQGHDQSKIWSVFAHRGMGFYAGSLSGNDSSPAADTHVPPATLTTSTISGTVTHNASPVRGATVTLAFQGEGAVNPSAVTDGSGHYTITNVPVGSYGKLVATAANRHNKRASVTVGGGGATIDFSLS
jgi:extracellular elastinolytic metalloproteinase